MSEQIIDIDAVVIGAGISGICAGYHLQHDTNKHLSNTNKQLSFVILESRMNLGGTWDLFRYPGIRSDSDMFTLGFPFNPWSDPKGVADGPAILQYLNDTVEKFGLKPYIRFGTKVFQMDFSNKTHLWTIQATTTTSSSSSSSSSSATSSPVVYRARFVFMCTGYYNYDQGYYPGFVDEDKFAGRIIHPQKWPQNLDYKGKRVVVIGSGATAVTLVPAMAEDASHVTMLQRSPTYMVAAPREGAISSALLKLPAVVNGPVIKWIKVFLSSAFWNLSKAYPKQTKKLLIDGLKPLLPEGYDVKKHFTPSYNPWDQRLCLVPDGDLFVAIKKGKASVVTDHIDRFTPSGILLKSGEKLDCDIIVAATGLNLLPLAGIQFSVDGVPVRLPESVTYKAFMLNTLPNLNFATGYTNASWTLKCDLSISYFCRIINHMRTRGLTKVVPTLDSNNPIELVSNWGDLDSGYIRRAVDAFPRQGKVYPWAVYQNYFKDYFAFNWGSVDDGVLRYSSLRPAPKL